MLKKIRVWLPALLWMGFIFAMSAAPGDVSGAQSGRLVRLLLGAHRLFFGEAQPAPEVVAALETLVRKAAHMAEYAVLALLYMRALCRSSANRPTAAALLLCALYAATDELHQAFVPDRGPAALDVVIDTFGAAIGLAVRRAALWARTKIRKPHSHL